MLEIAATDVSQQFFVVRLELSRGEIHLFHEYAKRVLGSLRSLMERQMSLQAAV